MPKRITYGPRYAYPSYTVKVRGEHGCTMTGNPETALAQVACYLESRPAGCVDIEYEELCGRCNGHGRVPGKRRMQWLECKHCKGQPELLSYRLTTHVGPQWSPNG